MDSEMGDAVFELYYEINKRRWHCSHATPEEIARDCFLEGLSKATEEIEWLNERLSKHEKTIREMVCNKDYIRKLFDEVREEVRQEQKAKADPYEYKITDGPRKAWDGDPDLSKEGWEEYQEWERYWRRLKNSEEEECDIAICTRQVGHTEPVHMYVRKGESRPCPKCGYNMTVSNG